MKRLPLWLLKLSAEVFLDVGLEGAANACMAELNRRGLFWSSDKGWTRRAGA